MLKENKVQNELRKWDGFLGVDTYVDDIIIRFATIISKTFASLKCILTTKREYKNQTFRPWTGKYSHSVNITYIHTHSLLIIILKHAEFLLNKFLRRSIGHRSDGIHNRLRPRDPFARLPPITQNNTFD